MFQEQVFTEFWVLYEGVHHSFLEVLAGVKSFACRSALKVALADVILFDSERGPEMEKTQSSTSRWKLHVLFLQLLTVEGSQTRQMEWC